MEAVPVGKNGEPERDVADFSPREHGAAPPPPKGLVERLEQLLAVVSKGTTIVGGVALVAMLALSIADIIGNKLFQHPVAGTPEFVGFLAVVVASFAMGLAIIERAHVQVDFFLNKLPPRLKASVQALVALLGLGIFVLLAWYSIRYGNELRASGEVSMTQRIPFYPFVYGVAFGCLPVCLYLFLELIRMAKKAAGR